MRSLSELVCLGLMLLLPSSSWLAQALDGPGYFRPAHYYRTVGGASRNFRHDTPFAPPPLLAAMDMVPEETKRRDSSKRHISSSSSSSKKIPFRPFASDEDLSSEFSNEFNSPFTSNEHDSREFTIGTQIRVQHPITVPKKASSSSVSHVKTSKPSHSSHGPYKSSSSYSEFKESRPEPNAAPSKQRSSKFAQLYEPSDPFHVGPPPPLKGSGHGYNSAYDGDDIDDYQPPSRGNKPSGPSSSSSSSGSGSGAADRFKGIASKKQIEQYLEDQQKLLDEALKLQLLNDPKFHQYVLSKEKERLVREQQFDSEEVHTNPSSGFSRGPGSGSARRRPQGAEQKRPLKGKPPVKSKPLPRRFRSAFVINV